MSIEDLKEHRIIKELRLRIQALKEELEEQRKLTEMYEEENEELAEDLTDVEEERDMLKAELEMKRKGWYD